MERIVVRDYILNPFKIVETKKYMVVFDDGERVLTGARIKLSSIYWMAHQKYPKTPLLIKHSVYQRLFGDKQHMALLDDIYQRMIVAYDLHATYIDKREYWGAMFDVVNNLYNFTVSSLSEYSISFDMSDYVEIMKHPKFIEMRSSMNPNQDSITRVINEVKQWLMTTRDLEDNDLVLCVQTGTAKIDQLIQSILVRGFITEIDSTIYPIPVMSSFANGFTKLYELIVEMRSAAKALLFQGDPLRDAEFFNRKTQLVGQVVRHFDINDCGAGGKEYVIDDQHELNWISGAYRVLDDGSIKHISTSDIDLIGKPINIRNVWSCKSPISQGVCWACMGDLSHSYPPVNNPGHISAAVTSGPVTQLTMGVKHHDGTSEVDAVAIEPRFDSILDESALFQGIDVSSELLKLNPVIYLSTEDVIGIESISECDISEINPVTTSRISSIKIEYDLDKVQRKQMKIEVGKGSRLAYLTRQALAYISMVGYKVCDKQVVAINLSKWPEHSALFRLPFKHTNMSDYKNDIEKFLLTSKANHPTGLRSYNRKDVGADPMRAVKDFGELVNLRLFVNYTHVQMLAYTVSAKLDAPGHILPKNNEPFNFIGISDQIGSGSLGVRMAYQEQGGHLRRATASNVATMTHPLDELLK